MELRVLKNLPAGWRGKKVKGKYFESVVYSAHFVPKRTIEIAKREAKEEGLTKTETKKLIDAYKDYDSQYWQLAITLEKRDNTIHIEIETPHFRTKTLRAKTPAEANKKVLNFMRKLSKRKTYLPLNVRYTKQKRRELKRKYR